MGIRKLKDSSVESLAWPCAVTDRQAFGTIECPLLQARKLWSPPSRFYLSK